MVRFKATAPEQMAKRYVNLPDLVRILEEKGVVVTRTENTSLTAPADINVERIREDVASATSEANADVDPTEQTIVRKGKGKKGKKLRKAQAVPSLPAEELDAALTHCITEFPRIERTWTTPPPNVGQLFCTISFLPAKGASPDADGYFGMVRVNGTHPNKQEAELHGERLIRDVDSYHPCYIGWTGHALPLKRESDDDDIVLEVDHVGLTKKMQEELSADMKERRAKEIREMDEAKTRAQQEQQREAEAIRGNVDEKDRYVRLQVKRANLLFSIYSTLEDLKRRKDTLLQTMKLIAETDARLPHLNNEYVEEYVKESERRGVKRADNLIVPFLGNALPFSLDLIPDKIPVISMPKASIGFVNEESIIPHDVAKKMLDESEKQHPGGPASVHETTPLLSDSKDEKSDD